MTSRTVLIANDPQAYRESIAVAIGILCPEATVIVAEPDMVDEFVTAYSPHVVLCSHLTPLVEAQVPTWAVLYPDGSENTLIQMAGSKRQIPHIELNGIVRLVDETKLADPV